MQSVLKAIYGFNKKYRINSGLYIVIKNQKHKYLVIY